MRAIVEAEKGEWIQHEASVNSDHVTIRLERLEIYLKREKFSDLVVTTCHTLTIIEENKKVPIGCPHEFSSIDAILETSAVASPAHDFSYSPVLEWQAGIFDGNIKVRFDTFPERSPNFSAIRWRRK